MGVAAGPPAQRLAFLGIGLFELDACPPSGPPEFDSSSSISPILRGPALYESSTYMSFWGDFLIFL
jgi:hypothetical protein